MHSCIGYVVRNTCPLTLPSNLSYERRPVHIFVLNFTVAPELKLPAPVR